MDKDVDDMDEEELKEEMEKLLEQISKGVVDQSDFEGKMIMKKKNEEGEVVETRETSL